MMDFLPILLHTGTRLRAALSAVKCVPAAALVFGIGFGTAHAGDPDAITYMTFAGYEDPMFHPAYIEEYGGSPAVTFFSDEHEAIAKLNGGFRADVVHVCTDNLPYWRGHDLLKPLDESKLRYLDDVLPRLRDISTIKDDEGLWMIPWDWGFVSVLYRTDQVTFDEESFSVLLDPAYKGKVSIQDSITDVGPTVALISGAADPFNLSDSEIDSWHETLRELNRQSRFYWSDPSALQQAMAAGEVVAAMGWPDTVASLRADGYPVDIMMHPKEGLLTWVCGLALLKDGEGDEDQAYDLINAMTAPEAARALTEEFYLANANLRTYAEIDPQHLKDLQLDDVGAKLENARIFEPVDPGQRARLMEIFEAVKAGL